jgi:hypothetical protein
MGLIDTQPDLPPAARIPLLVLGVVSLLLGTLGGLWRLGWEPPLPGTEPATFHGALMAAAFFGTVIGLERAVASGHRLAYIGPLCAGLGGVATALGAPFVVSATLLLLGSIGLALLTFVFLRRQPAPHLTLLLIGALCGVVGNLLWLFGLPASAALGGWIGFLVLTIVGERLELSRLRRPQPGALRWLAAATAVFLLGGLLLVFSWNVGAALTGAALFALALWLLIHDIAVRNLQHHSLQRFTAVCLVSGYVWLALGGLLLPFASAGGLLYDAALHTVFLGFVFGMVFGHAPIIFPAVLRVKVPYTPVYYLHVGLLQLTLALRVAGDLAQQESLRAWGGLGNAAALLLFLLLTAGNVLRARQASTD